MSSTSQFDLGTAALEHLELLNRSNQNPLEIAAQFRTLLRSKKANRNVHSPNNDFTYADYIAADATLRRRGRSHGHIDHRSKSMGKIQYDLNESETLPETKSSSIIMKYVNDENSYSNPSDAINPKVNDVEKLTKENFNSIRSPCPTINWKQLREKQYENKLDKVKKFLSTKFKTVRLSRIETKGLTLSSSTNVSDKTESCTNSNKSDLENNSSYSSRSRSSSNSIRTPSISPANSRRTAYTVSRLNSTLVDHHHDAIFIPIADCNLVIKHQPAQPQTKRISHMKHLSQEKKPLVL